MKDGKSGGGLGSQVKNYFGTIGGVVCGGPVDELVALVIDGATVWPTRRVWAGGTDSVASSQYRRAGGVARVQFQQPCRLQPGEQFVLTGMPDNSFNAPAATAVVASSPNIIAYNNAGADVAWTPADTGRLTKVVAYTAGTLVMYLGSVWSAVINHSGLPATAPPNATYWARYSVKRATSANPFVFTVFNRGQVFFYWGTANQVLDVASEKILSATGHPPYRHQAVVVLKNFLFGTEKTQAPNVQVLMRRQPAQTIIAGAAALLDADGQANPMCILAEALTDPVFGLGLDPALIDATSWQAVADALAANASSTYLSPLLDQTSTLRAFAGLLLSYFDGWVRFNSSGLIEAGRFLHNEAPPVFTAATTIDYHDLIDEIQFDSLGWAQTWNETLVKFVNRDRAFGDDSALWVSGFNRDAVGEARRNSLDRPWITRAAQALTHSAEYGKINAQTKVSGNLVVRAEKATSIAQGDLFKLTHDALQMSVVCRCVQKTISAPPAGRVTLRFESERGIAPIPYSPTPGTPGGTVLPSAEKIAVYWFVQPPAALGTGQDFELMVLAARTSEMTRGLRPWFRVDDVALLYELGKQTAFAVNGALAQNYGVAAAGVTVERGRAANVATLKVVGHGYATGLHVTVGGLGGAGYNLSDVVITITDANHFTYPSAGADEATTADAGGTVTPQPDDDSETLQINLAEFTVQGDVDRISLTQTLDAINDNALLVWLVKAGAPTQFEIATVKAIRLDAGVYKLKVRRRRFSTVQVAFVTGDVAWIGYRSDLVAYTHQKFGQYAQAATAATFRLQSFTAYEEADLTDPNICPDIAVAFADPYAPVISWTALKAQNVDIVFSGPTVERSRAANVATLKVVGHGLTTGNYVNVTGVGGAGYNIDDVAITVVDADHFTYASVAANEGVTADAGGTMTRVFQPTDVFQFTFQITDANADLTEGKLVARLGSVEKTLWAQTFPPSGLQLKTTTFTLTDGEWRVFCLAKDLSGRVIQYELRPVGGAGTVTVKVLTAGSNVVASPVASPPGDSYRAHNMQISLSCSTNGATIKYQVVNYGVAYNNANWVNYAAPFMLYWGTSSKRLWTKGTKGGMTDSTPLADDYWYDSSL